MKIDIKINTGKDEHAFECETFDEAIRHLQDLQLKAIKSYVEERKKSRRSRCSKCVYSNQCSGTDQDGSCKKYKYDPPDGGYYG